MKKSLLLILACAAAGAAVFAFGTWALRESGKQKILSGGGDFATVRSRYLAAGFSQDKHYDGSWTWSAWGYDSKTEDAVTLWAFVGAVAGAAAGGVMVGIRGRIEPAGAAPENVNNKSGDWLDSLKEQGQKNG